MDYWLQIEKNSDIWTFFSLYIFINFQNEGYLMFRLSEISVLTVGFGEFIAGRLV